MKSTTRVTAGIAVAVAIAIPLAGCSNGGDSSAGASTTVNWWTWDDKQAASYQMCVEPFREANPDIDVAISQYGWGDYWTKLTAGFLAGNGPDAFQNNVGFYPEFTAQNQLLPLDDLIARDDFDMGKFSVGTSSWTYSDDKVYGLPMDWSATGFYYNKDLLQEAGVSENDIATMTWNPDDGGTFEKIVSRLTVDKNGVRGDETGFDKDNIAVYGIANQGSKNVNGGDTWAQFAGTTGWTLGNKANWPTSFQFSDPRFEATVSYLRDLSAKGFAPDMGEFTLGLSEQLGSQSVAMVTDGSWMATTYAALPDLQVGIAPTVIGPEGDRASLSASSGNTIWSGSKNTDQAWKWISYMASEECQSLAGADGTFFPSIPASMDVTAKALLDKGVDVSPFTDQLRDGTLFESPIYGRGQEIDAAVAPLMEAYFTFQRDADAFAEADKATSAILAD